MDALLNLQTIHREIFALGLLGDTMQRIYAEGKQGLAEAIPDDWARPIKAMNHRCPKRVITLINKLRADDDGQEQRPRSDAIEGVVRLFLAPTNITDPAGLESQIAAKMSEATGDEGWSAGPAHIKTLALEHMMSARRFGFEEFFAPLYNFERMRTGLLDGSGRGLGFFTREFLPLAKALTADDKFAVAATIRKTSPLLDRNALEAAGEKQHDMLSKAKAACDGLKDLLYADPMPSLKSVLLYIAEKGLFVIPDILAPLVITDAADTNETSEKAGDLDDTKSETAAWRLALEAPFEQIEKYDHYVRGVSQFDTHQGVKGREFPRVMVVISDEEARGFLFSYGKLMGIKEKTKADLANEAAGKETSLDRTRRLFYVTCSRAEESLAIVYYSANPSAARDGLIAKGWFAPEEIEII
jgi:DNA helicase-2/ATP-dependent DNA helicase PcrA